MLRRKKPLDRKLPLRRCLGYGNIPVSAAASTEGETGRHPEWESKFSASSSLNKTTYTFSRAFCPKYVASCCLVSSFSEVNSWACSQTHACFLCFWADVVSVTSAASCRCCWGFRTTPSGPLIAERSRGGWQDDWQPGREEPAVMAAVASAAPLWWIASPEW